MTCTVHGQKHTGGLQQQRGAISGTESWIVRSDDPFNDREPQVLAALGVSEGDLHPDAFYGNRGVTCRGVMPNRDGERHLGLWVVNLTWGNGAESKQDKERRLIPNPLERPPTIEGIIVRETKPALKDSENRAYENTAGDPLEMTEEYERDQIRVRANLPIVPAWYGALRRTKNKDPIYISDPIRAAFPAGTVRFIPIGFSNQRTENDVEFVEVNFVLDTNLDGWDLEIANKGFNMLRTADDRSTKEPITVKGMPIQQAHWLNPSGLLTTTPTYIERKPFAEADYDPIQEILDRA